MDTSSESDSSSRSRSPLPPPPKLEELERNHEKACHSSDHLHFSMIVDKIIDDIEHLTPVPPRRKTCFRKERNCSGIKFGQTTKMQ
ncbi:hypothetical protein TNIN_408411 [Trichonephila inaurata madagascariensis]|uniref:Uncharacterized protein n=1 Tax=Trichonephila inaurata madagascariensis TaxID=2747483 RepID=A0A8X7BVR8_9ARAC|nr:hypothetical protein TNIN_408411 [Trichonephila inaurata madagascariensis]